MVPRSTRRSLAKRRVLQPSILSPVKGPGWLVGLSDHSVIIHTTTIVGNNSTDVFWGQHLPFRLCQFRTAPILRLGRHQESYDAPLERFSNAVHE